MRTLLLLLRPRKKPVPAAVSSIGGEGTNKLAHAVLLLYNVEHGGLCSAFSACREPQTEEGGPNPFALFLPLYHEDSSMFFLLFFNPFLIAAAIIPAIVLLVRIYRADRLDKEPSGLLLSLVFYGIFATGLAMFTERIGTSVLSGALPEDSAAYRAWLYFLVVAGSEEGFKYLLLRRSTWHHPAFNCQFDGVVYATFVSLGFALWENISYVLMYGFSTAMVRAVTAVPGHACFGVFMGAWYGQAKRWASYGYPGRSRLCSWLAFLLPVLLHGCYDFIASKEDGGGAWTFVIFVLILFIIAFILVKRLSQRDRYIDGPDYGGDWR